MQVQTVEHGNYGSYEYDHDYESKKENLKDKIQKKKLEQENLKDKIPKKKLEQEYTCSLFYNRKHYRL